MSQFNAETLHGYKDQARDTLDSFKTIAQDSFDRASHQYQDTVDRMKDTSLSDVKTTAARYVKDNPVRAGAMMVGLGIVIGIYAAWRRRK